MAVIIPVVKITGNNFTCYNRYEDLQSKRGFSVNSQKNLTRGVYNGNISSMQRKRIASMIENLHSSMNFDLLKKSVLNGEKLRPVIFITLTLSQKQFHNDAFIKRNMFGLFLKNMQKKGYLNTYIWRSESQQNGNIHFHIVSKDFIDKKIIQKTWNKIQLINGYMDNRLLSGIGSDAPSTHIMASYSLSCTSAYIGKYVSKNENNRKIEGRIWGCSDNLRNIQDCVIICDNELKELINVEFKKGTLNVWHSEHCTVFSGNVLAILAKNNDRRFQAYLNNCKTNSKKVNGTFVEKEIKKMGALELKNDITLSSKQIFLHDQRLKRNLLASQLKINY